MARRSNCVCYMARFIFEVVIRWCKSLCLCVTLSRTRCKYSHFSRNFEPQKAKNKRNDTKWCRFNTNKGKIGTIWYSYVQLVETHFLISLTYHSSSRWKPQKCFPSPPKSQGLITSKDFKGRRWCFPWCNNTCALRRNLRLLACFPFFCDLQQHHVLTGIRFLLLLIVS